MSVWLILWTVGTGLLFQFLAWRTRNFADSILSLKDMPLDHNPPVGRTQWPRVSLVIPACNEADTIEPALASLLNINYPDLEIILVDDRSTDGTGEIIDRLAMTDHSVRALHIHELPAGWLGKVHALEKGMALTTGEWILLTDADVHFSREALKKAIAFSLHQALDFLTVIPDVKTRGFGLRVMMAQLFHQASIFFNPRKINHPSHKACYGQGAFNLLRRTAYEVSEGMRWLHMEVVDDTGLAYLMRRAGAKMGAVAGLDEIKIEWYPSLQGFLKGLEKNGFAFSQYSKSLLASQIFAALVVFLGFTVVPLFTRSAVAMAFCWSSLVIYLFAIHSQLKKIIKVGPFTILAFPVSFVVLQLILLRSAYLNVKRGGISWRGTFYKLADLRANQKMKLASLVFSPSPAKPLSHPPPQAPRFLVESEDIAMLDEALGNFSVRVENPQFPITVR